MDNEPLIELIDLVKAAKDGSQDAFAQLLERHRPMVVRRCNKVLDHNPHDVEDATQQTFIAAWEHLHQLNDPVRFPAWLDKIATNAAIQVARQRRASPGTDVLLLHLPDDGASPEELTLQAERQFLVWAAADGLAAKDRELLRIHLREGLEGKELAERLGVTRIAAYVRLHRVRRRLHPALTAWVLYRRERWNPCPAMRHIRGSWDQFDQRLAQEVTEHAQACDICQKVARRLVTPKELLAAAPLVAVLRELEFREFRLTRMVAHARYARDVLRDRLVPTVLLLLVLAVTAALHFINDGGVGRTELPQPSTYSGEGH